MMLHLPFSCKNQDPNTVGYTITFCKSLTRQTTVGNSAVAIASSIAVRAAVLVFTELAAVLMWN